MSVLIITLLLIYTYSTAQFDDIQFITDKLSNQPGVQYAVPNQKITLSKNNITELIEPKDLFFNLQWGLKNKGQVINGQQGKQGVDINVLKAWSITTGSPNVIVGILDTGVDSNHEDLKNNIFKNSKEIAANRIDDDGNGYIDDVNGWDFANDDDTVFDSAENDMHGTHVSGIIGAEKNMMGICGVAPNVRILPLKFISENGGYISDAIEAIEYGKKMGVNVFNCSWTIDYNDSILEAEMKNMNAVFVCAAGNNSVNLTIMPSYPACYKIPNIISVAAMDNQGKLASFSNYGDVSLAAPGVSIFSTIPSNQYSYLDGTSMAAPFVAGVVALMKSKQGSISPIDIVSKIKKSVTRSKDLTKVSTGGFLNAYNALNLQR